MDVQVIKKEYYRLDELNKRFDVSFDDVRYWVESGELDLAYYTSNRKFILGGWQKSKGYIGFAVATYTGLLTLTNKDHLELLEKGEVNCREVQLLNEAKIELISTEYPFKTSYPNEVMVNWQPDLLSQISASNIIASVIPNEVPYAMKTAGRSILSALELIGNKNNSDVKVDTSVYDNLPDYQFQFDDIELTTKDICIPHEDLVSVGVIKENEVLTHSSEPKSFVSSNEKERTSDLHELLTKILISNRGISSKKIWSLLEAEAAAPKGERKYDTYNILRDISSEEIYWVSRLGSDNYLKFCSLAPTLSKLKKRLDS